MAVSWYSVPKSKGRAATRFVAPKFNGKATQVDTRSLARPFSIEAEPTTLSPLRKVGPGDAYRDGRRVVGTREFHVLRRLSAVRPEVARLDPDRQINHPLKNYRAFRRRQLQPPLFRSRRTWVLATQEGTVDLRAQRSL